jgi:hypothetical protein
MPENFTKLFDNNKKTLRGKDDYFFLINDSNEEIRQHYDPTYTSNFHKRKERFKKSQKSKLDYLNKLNIKYGLFVVPDKSVILRKYLPFETEKPYRYVDEISEYVNDLAPILTENDFQLNDTHTTHRSSVKSVAYMLNILHPEHTMLEYNKLLWEKLDIEMDMSLGDLFFEKNWNASKDDPVYKKYSWIPMDRVNSRYAKQIPNETIPKEFRLFGVRPARYYRNENSVSDKKALIFHDSSTLKYINTISTYYRETFFYWDHWFFYNDLVKWFKPDDVLEIRTERFFGNPLAPVLDEDGNVPVAINLNLEKAIIDQNNNLNIKLYSEDIHHVPVTVAVAVYLNDKFILDDLINDGSCIINHKLNDNYTDDEYELKLVTTVNSKYREKIQEQKITRK